jgi:hypothetical protein
LSENTNLIGLNMKTIYMPSAKEDIGYVAPARAPHVCTLGWMRPPRLRACVRVSDTRAVVSPSPVHVAGWQDGNGQENKKDREKKLLSDLEVV